MPRPRSEIVNVDDTPWYHVVGRCVRRAYLCGVDPCTGRNHDHRREWVQERILQLSSVFAIDVAAFAVLSNHYHIVVRIDDQQAKAWTNQEVASRWTQLFAATDQVQLYLQQPDDLTPDELQDVVAQLEIYRKRLWDLSWFMRVLNESIARKANEEDDVTGHFWEGRFKSQALLDEAAILTVMAYVDLNPIRAGIANSLLNSDFTSVAMRLQELLKQHQTAVAELPEADKAAAAAAAEANSDTTPGSTKPGSAESCQRSLKDAVKNIIGLGHDLPSAGVAPMIVQESPDSDLEENPTRLHNERRLALLPLAPLMPFDPSSRNAAAIHFDFVDYLELVDDTGRIMREDKKGYIRDTTPKILEQINLRAHDFINQISKPMSRRWRNSLDFSRAH